jgi:hypothetical protein
MLTRSLLTSVIPGERRRRRRPRLLTGLRVLMQRMAGADRRSLEIKARADANRERCLERHNYGRGKTWL